MTAKGINVVGHWLSRAAERIERAEWLDPFGRALQRAVAPLGARPLVRDLLSGTPVGHPVHPLLVTVPIGSWTGALVLDLVGNHAAARTMVGLGVLAAAPTAVTGLSDWKDTADGDARVGLVHAAANTAVVSLYTASWLARRVGAHRLGSALTWPALGLLGVSGWLGGHLSYARGVGVDVTAWDRFEPEWTDVGPAGSLATPSSAGSSGDATPAELRRVDLHGTGVLVTRTSDGVLVAYADRCTHRGGPLSEGALVGKNCVECPWHASRFDLTDGSVVSGPATRPQPAYAVRIEGDRLLLRRAPA